MNKYEFTFQLPSKGHFSTFTIYDKDVKAAIEHFRNTVGNETVFVLKKPE